MSGQPYMPFWIGKFVADTLHLSAEETGAYIMLLGAMWLRGGTLPSGGEAKEFARIARVHPSRWSRVWENLKPFFTDLGDGTITQKRLANELKRASGIREANSQKAKLGWEVKRKSGLSDVTNKNNNLGDATALPQQYHGNVSHTHTHLATNVAKRERRSHQLPQNWAPNEGHFSLGRKLGHSAEAVEDMVEAMRCWAWGKGEARKNWDMVFSGWVRREKKGHGPPRLSRTEQASMKIIEEFESLGHNTGNGTSRRGLRGESGELSAGLNAAPATQSRGLPAPAHHSLHGKTKMAVEEDG